MRVMRIVFVSALVMVTGCGGCDSCFGTAQPGDDAAATTSTTSPRALPRDDAGDASADELDASRDASPEAAQEYPARDGGVPRPKAPMPLGDFQVCGVYDGPKCEKACLKGNCRQECDGVECELTCNGGWCSQLCGPSGKCKLTCNGGHCVQVCTRPEDCVKVCPQANCE